MSASDPPASEVRPALSIPPSEVSVLVVDDDNELRSALLRDLGRQGFSVRGVSSTEEAIALLKEARVDVLLTDLRMTGRSGLELLDEVRLLAPDVRPILMSAHASARDHEGAVGLGAVRVLNKPFSPDELLDAIRQAIDCAVGFRGSVHGLSLVDMLQMFHFGRRSVSIHVNGGAVGTVHMQKGQFVHAQSGTLSGQGALRALLAGASGSVRTSTLQTTDRTLTGEFDSVLLDALRDLDETSRRGTDLDDFEMAWPDSPTSSPKNELASTVKKEVPGASAWLISDGRAEALVGGEEETCVPAAVDSVIAGIMRLAPDWSAFDVVTREGTLGVVRQGTAQSLVVWMDTSRPRAVQRFRSHFAKLSRVLMPGMRP